jgi:hypothetical protein
MNADPMWPLVEQFIKQKEAEFEAAEKLKVIQYHRLLLVRKDGSTELIRVASPAPIVGVKASDAMPTIEDNLRHFEHCGRLGDLEVYYEIQEGKIE